VIVGKTLILNASAEPLTFVPVRRAIILVLKEKAEVIEEHVEKRIRSEKREYPYPLVIRLIKYVEIPRRLRGIVTNSILFARDHYACQYCGRHKSEFRKGEYLTREHVKPLCKGGTDTWDNVTTACSACNYLKGNRLPYEAKMYPKATPFEPRYIVLVLLEQSVDPVQRRYIEPFLKRVH